MRAALFVSLLVVLPVAAADEIRLTSPVTPFRTDLVAGLNALAVAIQASEGLSPCEDERSKVICELAEDIVQDLVDVALCIKDGHEITNCFAPLAGIACLMFNVSNNPILPFKIPEVNPAPLKLSLSATVSGAGVEMQVGGSSPFVDPDRYGGGVYTFVFNEAAAC